MEIITKSRFERDITKLKRQNKDFSKLEIVLNKLILGEKLPPKYKNHPLIGNWKPCWKLHIEPDWLLIYFIEEKEGKIILYRIGSHSDLF